LRAARVDGSSVKLMLTRMWRMRPPTERRLKMRVMAALSS
jgi:hypothetical protein